MDLERCQVAAVKLIHKNYKNFTDSLIYLGLENLEYRRQKLHHRFASRSAQYEKMKEFFQENNKIHNM